MKKEQQPQRCALSKGGRLENTESIEQALMAQKATDGKDELNLAEFPLCALSRRLRPDQKTLRFEDRIWDKSRDEWIPRQLTITGSDAYGLPTSTDDEILLGLIQLTRQRNFSDRKVPFTRHELLRLLGWSDDTKSYRRLEQSLNRWMGVTLYYQNAWWNRARKAWVDVKFHVLDNVWLCHRGEPLPDTGITEPGAPTSAFVWNEVIFRSFQAGNLKSIDFEFFKSLDSAIAKRLYRFLDKRFWRREHCEFHLRELSCQHLGLSQSYDTANLKRKLLSGIRELEARGFLKAAPDSHRFRKLRAGIWLATFEKGTGAQPPVFQEAHDSTNSVRSLIERGVSPAVAASLADAHPPERIQAQIAVFDWLMRRHDRKVSRNPAGFLVAAIKNQYSTPKSFPTIDRSKRKTQRPLSDPELTSMSLRPVHPPIELKNERRNKIEEFWLSLPPEKKHTAEQEALANASPFHRDVIDRNGPLAAVSRQCILDAYALKAMRQQKR